MNSRILELIKNPELIAAEDLNILGQEIGTKPYMQSLRALQLLAVNRFDSENYQKTLSETAAYTTDKKILYQLINGKNIAAEPFENISAVTGTSPVKEEVKVAENEVLTAENDFSEQSHEHSAAPVSDVPLEAKHEAEELSAEHNADETENVSAQNQAVSADIEIQEKENIGEEIEKLEDSEQMTDESKVSEPENSEIETVTEPVFENNDQNPETTDENSAEISFQGTQDFMPEVAIRAGEVSVTPTAPQKPVNRHEEEMRRLIEEVERKMQQKKASQQEKTTEKEEAFPGSHEISFAETMDFDTTAKKTDEVEEKVNPAEAEPDESKKVETPVTEEPVQQSEPVSTWKPMSLETATPDAIIAQSQENVSAETIKEVPVSDEKKSQPSEEKDTVKTDDSSLQNTSDMEKPVENSQESVAAESNVPKFINTWQSWLKIDRKSEAEAPVQHSEKEELSEENEETEPETEETEITVEKTAVKNSVIDKFIETEPKISQLKEESSFVVREKKNDISHLMTETLANIYAEQKLYAKAIKGYEILIEKHPERKSYFREKIKEVKELRTNSNQQ